MALLLNQIKSDQLAARRARDTLRASLLTTLYSEASTIGLNLGKRDSTDQEVIQVIKKFIKNIDECVNAGADPDDLLEEKKILEGYLPNQLTEDQITDIVLNILNGLDETKKNIGKVTGLLKADYAGQYDGATASKVIKSLLS